MFPLFSKGMPGGRGNTKFAFCGKKCYFGLFGDQKNGVFLPWTKASQKMFAPIMYYNFRPKPYTQKKPHCRPPCYLSWDLQSSSHSSCSWPLLPFSFDRIPCNVKWTTKTKFGLQFFCDLSEACFPIRQLWELQYFLKIFAASFHPQRRCPPPTESPAQTFPPPLLPKTLFGQQLTDLGPT